MGRKSTRENKTIYQRLREEDQLTREKAAELLEFISEDRLERIENEKTQPAPEDIIRMSQIYNAPELCNYYCSRQCPIGQKYVPPVEMTDLPAIILKTVASLNTVYPLTNRLIEISRDGKISENEVPDFSHIQENLERFQDPLRPFSYGWKKKRAKPKVTIPHTKYGHNPRVRFLKTLEHV